VFARRTESETVTKNISYYAMARSDQTEQLNLVICGEVGRLPLYSIDDMKRWTSFLPAMMIISNGSENEASFKMECRFTLTVW
jgi:hypothetical protein